MADVWKVVLMYAWDPPMYEAFAFANFATVSAGQEESWGKSTASEKSLQSITIFQSLNRVKLLGITVLIRPKTIDLEKVLGRKTACLAKPN